jgi:YYY domain-containing protein
MNNLRSRLWIYDLLFVLILLMAAYFRLSGLNWDQSQHLHPDERFLTMVESAMRPVDSLSAYFDTATSTLNPHNVGFGFYVYGDLPIILVRYAAEWMSDLAKWAAETVQANGVDSFGGPLLAVLGETTTWAGYDEVALVGRVLSAFSDLGSILLLYLIAARLYGRKVGLLAATFSALAVMQIQQSHFFTVDTFANFFMFLATYFAVEVMVGEEETHFDFGSWDAFWKGLSSPLVLNTLGFGLALGASVASKINAAPLAVLLPGALIIRYFRLKGVEQKAEGEEHNSLPEGQTTEATTALGLRPAAFSIETLIVLLVLGAIISALAFRVFQPYAFSGPGFLGVTPNPKWVSNITEQRNQASGDVDFPPALQWARRPAWFSVYNLVAWGLGWPLGILAWAGFLYMGWRILKGEWKEHLLLWGWTGAYFIWQSMQWNPTMRYQLPIYPLLAMMAGWFIFNGPRFPKPTQNGEETRTRHYIFRIGYSVLAIAVLAATFAWTYAFTRIYTRDHSRVQATRWIYQNIPGPYNLKIRQADGSSFTQPMSMPQGYVITQGAPYDVQFVPFASGDLTEIFLANAAAMGAPGAQSLTITLYAEPDAPADKVLATASLDSDFAVKSDPRGEAYTLKFDGPILLEKGRTYFLRFVSSGALALIGTAPVHETSWDDGLPLRMDGYDAYGGMYQGDLNFEMYWDDNADKLSRFETNLDAGDYVFITSNRQWATTTRVPERYPLTVAYYRNLIGCPEDKDVIWCYNVAEPGMFKGNFGFELVQTFTSYPEIFGHQFNTQFAEEAFTVYDAPKVLLFKKTDTYHPQTVRAILGAVDLTRVIRVTPRQAGRIRHNLPSLLLPADLLAEQRAGGTWSEMFSYQSLQNKYPFLGLVIWYLAIGLLGLFTWPILRLLLPGLPDKGYPLARLAGLLLLAFGVWLAASLGGQYSRLAIAAGYGLILVAGAIAFVVKRDEIRAEVRSQGKYFLLVEGLFLAFFLIDLAIRLGNPDLWHAARGGERPMDFAYLNAVLKSTSFPPYDPWFAGGYINYYYWGYVLVGTPIKLLGIVPSIAYNFVLPTLFALLGIGGFSVAWNLIDGFKTKDDEDLSPFMLKLIVGIAAGAGLVLLGNLGTLQLIYHALQKLVVTNEMVDSRDVWAYQHLIWAAQGAWKLVTGLSTGVSLPIGWGEYYWAPSRVMPVGDLAITEFPLFTFIYSDLHAHMIALPLTVLSVAWALSTLLARKLSRWSWLATLAFGGLVIGSLRPTNTWDFPTYLTLGALVTGYAIFRYAGDGGRWFGFPPVVKRVFLALLGMGIFVGFAFLLYQPFAQWFGQAYTQVSLWKNEKTPIWSYWTHWGLFLFVILSWMLWETRQWLAQTPISALAKLKPYELLIEMAVAVFVALLLALQFILKVPVAWFAFPMAVWALVLMLRPGQPDVKRLVLFMVSTGLVLTLVVEFIVLVGDIGRMNTVFKFYLQVWVLFALSAAAALGWITTEFDEWGRIGRVVFQVFGGFLLAGALLYPFAASMDKIRDRIAPNLPFTFDSMTYMLFSRYGDSGADMDLSQDYRAIRWLQDNVKGSPVVLEAAPAGIQYTWFSRISIYTGLPTVVGWQWHQEQQRALMPPGTVAARGVEAQSFYRNNDIEMAKAFLEKYNVGYIVVGQQERVRFPEGMAKFDEQNGKMWKEVYREADTVIYEVLP